MCSYSAHSTCSKGGLNERSCSSFCDYTFVHSFPRSVESQLISIAVFSAHGKLEVCAEVGGVRQSAAESLEGAVGSDCPPAVAAAALHSPREHGMSTEVQPN